jgi:Tripartite tricarboxylate transporter family receptor
LPNIPTVGDFIPGYEGTGWQGIGAPKDTPTEIINKLNQETNASLSDPRMKARIADFGYTVFTSSPSEFTAYRRIYRKVGKGDQVLGRQGVLMCTDQILPEYHCSALLGRPRRRCHRMKKRGLLCTAQASRSNLTLSDPLPPAARSPPTVIITPVVGAPPATIWAAHPRDG